MAQTFAVNSNNDLYLDRNGNLAIVRDLQAVLQDCEHAAKAQLGEMIFAADEGIPNFQTIWNGGNPNIAQFEAALRQNVGAVVGVTSIRNIDILIQNNTLTYTMTIVTIYGAGVISG